MWKESIDHESDSNVTVFVITIIIKDTWHMASKYLNLKDKKFHSPENLKIFLSSKFTFILQRIYSLLGEGDGKLRKKPDISSIP